MDWKIFFNIFICNKEVFFEFVEIIDEGIFKNAIMSNMFILIRKFSSKHKKVPTFDTLTLMLDKLPGIEQENRKAYIEFIEEIRKFDTNIDVDIFKEELHHTIQNYEMEKFILKTANKVGNVTFEDVLSDIRAISGKFKPMSSGVDITDAERVVRLIRRDIIDKVTSGVESLDKMLSGGFGSGEIAIVMTPPGRGKSFFLLNVMYGALLAQKNVLYLTYELYEKSVLRRLYGRISFSSKKDMLDEVQVTRAANKFFTLSKAKGRILYAASKTMTVEGIEALMEQQKMYFDFVPDIVVVDYLDLLAPRYSDMKLEMRHRLRGITEDLRSLAVRKNIPIVSATQGNRASLSKVKVTEANVSESFGKVEVSDVVIAFCQNDEEKKMKRARLTMLKNRDYISGGCVEVYVDFEKMILLDLVLAEKFGLVEIKEPVKE